MLEKEHIEESYVLVKTLSITDEGILVWCP
jgi:hypothetical protein